MVPSFALFEFVASQSGKALQANNAKGGSCVVEAAKRFSWEGSCVVEAAKRFSWECQSSDSALLAKLTISPFACTSIFKSDPIPSGSRRRLTS